MSLRETIVSLAPAWHDQTVLGAAAALAPVTKGGDSQQDTSSEIDVATGNAAGERTESKRGDMKL